MQILIEIKTNVKNYTLYVTSFMEVSSKLDEISSFKNFEFLIYKKEYGNISEYELLSLKKDNNGLTVKYTNQDNIEYSTITIKRLKEFDNHIWRLLNPKHTTQSEIYFKEITKEIKTRDLKYKNWKIKYDLERKKSLKRKKTRNWAIFGTILLLASFLIYQVNKPNKFEIYETEIVKAYIYTTKWKPILRGKNRLVVYYSYTYENQIFYGKTKIGGLVLGYGHKVKNIGDSIFIEIIKNEPHIHRNYNTK